MTLIIVSKVSDYWRIDLENLLVMQSYNILAFLLFLWYMLSKLLSKSIFPVYGVDWYLEMNRSKKPPIVIWSS